MKRRRLIGLSRRYVAALRKHLTRGPRASLRPAKALGRQAVAGGLGTLELAGVHKRALTTLTTTSGLSPGRDGALRRAEAFFVEAITPLEETGRAMRQANVRLSQVNETNGSPYSVHGLQRGGTVEQFQANRALSRRPVGARQRRPACPRHPGKRRHPKITGRHPYVNPRQRLRL